MVLIASGLESKLKSYKLDIARDWTPARVEATGEGIGPDKVYLRAGSFTKHYLISMQGK